MAYVLQESTVEKVDSATDTFSSPLISYEDHTHSLRKHNDF